MYPHPELLVTFIGNHDMKRFLTDAGGSTASLNSRFRCWRHYAEFRSFTMAMRLACPGGEDPDNRHDFPGGFPGDAHDAFLASGRSPEEQEVFSHVQSLLRLRQQHVALRKGRQWHVGWDDNYYGFVRETADEKLFVIFNTSEKTRQITISTEGTSLEKARQFDNLFGTGQVVLSDKFLQTTLPPTSAAVYAVH